MAHIQRQGRLAVRRRRDRPYLDRLLSTEGVLGEEGGDRRATVVPGGGRRHDQAGVLSQQGGDASRVGALPCGDQAVEEHALNRADSLIELSVGVANWQIVGK